MLLIYKVAAGSLVIHVYLLISIAMNEMTILRVITKFSSFAEFEN